MSRSDLFETTHEMSQDVAWDFVMIDEAQDWPRDERDMIYRLYGHEHVVLADGVDQLIRSDRQTDWREHLDRSSTQVVTLHRSLRMKSSLCDFVLAFAEEMNILDWDLQPEPDVHGGRVIIVLGKSLDKRMVDDLYQQAAEDGNNQIDMLFCVPGIQRDVANQNGSLPSPLAQEMVSWGHAVWDGAVNDLRQSFPTDIHQFRIIPYDSCRGLEGWTAVCYRLDDLYDAKCKPSAAPTPSAGMQSDNTVLTDTELALAQRWLLIPLTRAIDTLVLHVADKDHYVAGILRKLKTAFPDTIEWHE
jgi:hypothetical protein